MIVKRDGNILTNQSTIPSEIVLKKVADFSNQSLMQKGLRSLSGSNLYQQEYEDPQNGDLTFFLKTMPGTPWVIATALPTALLTLHSIEVLKTLGLIQIPLVILLVVVLVFGISRLMKHLTVLRSNIDMLSLGKADLTRRIAIKGEDELDAVGHSVNRFIAYL